MSHGEDEDAMDECEFEITSTEGPVDAETQKFDTIIGALEDLLMSDGFSERQAEFCRAKCHVFEDTEENKLEYTSIFDEYTETLEAAMMGHLDESVEGFDAAEFFDMLEQREGQLDGDVFDLLMTLTSFEAFKELMLDYKREADGVGGVGMRERARVARWRGVKTSSVWAWGWASPWRPRPRSGRSSSTGTSVRTWTIASSSRQVRARTRREREENARERTNLNVVWHCVEKCFLPPS